MKAHVRQYAVATFTGLGLCVVQGWSAIQRFGLGGNNPKADLMQKQVAEHFLADLSLSATFAGFLLLVVVAHLLLTAGSVAVYRATTTVAFVNKRDRLLPCIAFLFASLLLAMFCNRWLFPLSSAFEHADLLMVQTFSPVLIFGLSIAVCAALVCALYVWFSRTKRRWVSASAVVMGMVLIGAWHVDGSSARTGAAASQPDVIILGIDSLRPDFVSTYGPLVPGLTPAIDGALSTSVLVDDARTPVARTFVSYQSLLTGENPIKHGARFNLYPRSEFSASDNLAWRLKEQGYTTMLAMDESRFANFDETFGFDVSIVPTVGALDFVVGSSFDFLATNLLIAMIPPTRWMSPVQGNRAAYRSYRADDHPARVLDALRGVPSGKPLFLVSHLCLPHWPYMPADVNGDTSLDWVRDVTGYEDSSTQYARALAVVDKQFAEITDELRRLGRLQNAIVMVISDHGEDFDMERDRLWIDQAGGRSWSSHGHGSFALSRAQNHVVMGVQRYSEGRPEWSNRRLLGAASIIDVAPTVADELSLPLDGYEGRSWLPELRGGGDLPSDRVRYFENGLRSVGVERAHIDEKEVAGEMSYLYRVTADDRFEIKPELLPQKLAEKQRGATKGRWGVMTDPRSDVASGAGDCWQALDYQSRVIGCVGYPAEQPEVAALQSNVCSYYASDVGFTERWCAATAASGGVN